MAEINSIQMHRIEMSILEQCDLNSFAILEALKLGGINYANASSEQIIIADERLLEKNALTELVDFCRSHYDRNLGFQSKMDDGFHTYFTCTIPAKKLIPFLQIYPPLNEFHNKLIDSDVDVIEVSFPEKTKILILDEFIYNKDSTASIFIEKYNDKGGPKFLIYCLSKYGTNITKFSYILERLYDCTIENIAKTNAVKTLIKRIKKDTVDNFGNNYINEITQPFDDQYNL